MPKTRLFVLPRLFAFCILGCLGVQDGVWGAISFQAQKQQQFFPRPDALELLWSEGEFTEGPAVAPDGAILFSDIGQEIYRFDPQTGRTEIYRRNSGRANGLMFDGRGRLIACEGGNDGNRRISVTDPDGTWKGLADSWLGRRFNSPNDLTINRRGHIYFTDPRYVGNEPRELNFEGIFHVHPSGEVELATCDVEKPNGLVFSLDERTLYVADHAAVAGGKRQLVAFRVTPSGTLDQKRVLFDFGTSRGIDGMTRDRMGNVFATAGSGEEAGIYVFDPEGRHLAWLHLPGDPTNCVFGKGTERDVLYITGQAPKEKVYHGSRPYGLYRIPLPYSE